MGDIERMASFYLGKACDPRTMEVIDDQPVMYDARDLTTHAVCVGMTGSGKTGLCVDLLEEAALDGIPSIIIDPKGDMANLLLSFPELRPADFEPWINVDDARRKGQSVREYSESVASLWSQGLAEWGQGPERIRKLRQAAEFVVYTPGSDAGVPISALQSFNPPALSWDDEEEDIRTLISGTISGLLGLLGVDADPVQSREHIFLSHVFEMNWRQGRELTLERLIQVIQDPPMARLGVLDVDTFFPEKDRFALAMRLNNLMASPSFENWIEGVPLDLDRLMYTSDGRPRVSIFYIAHLDDAERMFFVTLLLEQVLTWMRRLSGTTSLRALLYFDEVFGYFPPHPANPPSKRPLLTLLKLARAFGLGVMLTTQNPVDVDYKGLTNAGTWLIGKLQTDRDKARLLEGMEGVVSESGTMLDRAHLDRLISSLDSRVFVLHNVHEDRPLVFKTRWAMSYLRGPLTRSQVRQLMAPYKGRTAITTGPAPTATDEAAPRPFSLDPPIAQKTAGFELPEGYSPVQPRVNARVAQFYLAATISQERASCQVAAEYRREFTLQSAQMCYRPYLLGMASVIYADTRHSGSHQERISCLLPLPQPHSFIAWDEHIHSDLDPRQLETTPFGEALFEMMPDGMADSPPYTRYRDDLVNHIYRQHSLTAWQHTALKLYSSLGESREEFVARCEKAAQKALGDELEEVRDDLSRDIKRIEDRIAREERELREDEEEYEGRKREELLSGAESLIGLFSGRKSSRRLSQASRRRRLTQQAKADIEESEDLIEDLEKEIAVLEEELKGALNETQEKWADVLDQIEEVAIRPKKSEVHMEAFGLVWVPHWCLEHRDERGLPLVDVVPAYDVSPSKREES